MTYVLLIVFVHCIIGLFTWSGFIESDGEAMAKRQRNHYAFVLVACVAALLSSSYFPFVEYTAVVLGGWFTYTGQFLIALRGSQSFVFWLKNMYKFVIVLFLLAAPAITQAGRFV